MGGTRSLIAKVKKTWGSNSVSVNQIVIIRSSCSVVLNRIPQQIDEEEAKEDLENNCCKIQEVRRMKEEMVLFRWY